MRVQLMVTCLIDVFFPQVGEAVLKILQGSGVDVVFPKGQTCCGQPAYNAGYWDEARKMAIHSLDVFSDSQDVLIIPSGSCAVMVKYHYIELFKNDPHNLLRAKALAERTYELSQFLVDILGIIPQRGLYQGKIAYHPSCHLLRGMRVDRQPKALLKAVGVEVIPLEEECCGFGGVFSVDQPQLSTEMLKRKLKAIENSGAPLVVAADVSCLMHIEGGLRHAGSSVRCAHLAQILSGNVTSLR